jgi:putative ABC transport system permease protein
MLRTALKFIRYDRAKSIGVVIGVVISVFLIGQQIGILSFLTKLMGGLVGNSNQELGEIWVVDNITRNANELAKLDESLVRAIRSIEGVENTFPIVVANGLVKFDDGKTAPVILIGSQAPEFVAGPLPEQVSRGDLLALVQEGAVSAEYFDEATFDHALDLGTQVEINGKSAAIRVITRNARGFAGSFFFTTVSKARYFTNFPEDKVSAIAVKTKAGYSREQVVQNINDAIYGVRAWDSEDLRSSTVRFITVSSNIGVSIGSLVIFAVISGFFIIGLTLYSAALDRINDYGTLKAIGATNGYVRRLILTQATIFALSGFALAVLLLEGFKKGVAQSGLLIHYSPALYLGLFLVTLLISVGSCLFAIRKVNSVEPASVFR